MCGPVTGIGGPSPTRPKGYSQLKKSLPLDYKVDLMPAISGIPKPGNVEIAKAGWTINPFLHR
jgi:hypothetical protein